MTEADLIRILEEYVRIIRSQLQQPNASITQILSNIIGKIVTDEEAARYYQQISYLYDQMAQIFQDFAQSSTFGIYNNTANLTRQFLESVTKVTLESKPFGTDVKALQRLIRNMNQDFVIATQNGKSYIKSFVEFSKQGRLTESEIDLAVFKGYLDKGTAKGAKKILEGDLTQRITEDMHAKNPFYRKIRYTEIEGMTVSDAVKMRLKRDFEEKLSNNQYMPLVNKNGNIMMFKTRSYSDLVVRTRLGEAQVAGTIDAGQSRGIDYYKVTKHNTTTPACLPHEGKIYAVTKGDPKFAGLSDYTDYSENGKIKQSQNKPVYHPNCKHRLIPYPMTKREYERFPDRN